MKNFLDFIPQILSGLILGALGWMAGYKKSTAEADKLVAEAKKLLSESDLAIVEIKETELDMTKEAIAIWRQLAQDMRAEVDALHKVVMDLKLENKNLRNEVYQLKLSLQIHNQNQNQIK